MEIEEEDEEDVAMEVGGVAGVVEEITVDVLEAVFSQVGHRFSMVSPIESWRWPWENCNELL